MDNPIWMEVLIGKSPINGPFSSKPCLITGGYLYVEVSGKRDTPESSIFRWIFYYKPSIFGYLQLVTATATVRWWLLGDTMCLGSDRGPFSFHAPAAWPWPATRAARSCKTQRCWALCVLLFYFDFNPFRQLDRNCWSIGIEPNRPRVLQLQYPHYGKPHIGIPIG